jgi:sulfite reductase alpha subunit-like flavoprotein
MPWLQRTLDAIVPYLPGPSTLPLASTALPPPIYALEPAGRELESGLAGLSLDAPKKNNGNGTPVAANRAPAVYAPKGWKWATLVQSRRVTAKGWWQDVREFELELDDHTPYATGSVAVLHPRCSDTEVETFLELNGLEAEADRQLVVRSSVPGEFPPCSNIGFT